MKRRLRFIILLAVPVAGLLSSYAAMPGTPAQTENQRSFNNVPDPDTPMELQKIWLRFHEDNLCKKVDAVFLFHGNKMQVWATFEDEKYFAKLLKLLKPLQKSYQITLYKTYPNAYQKIKDIRTAPPSLWENSKLSKYFHNSFSPSSVTVYQRLPSYSLNSGSADYFRQNSSMSGMEISPANSTSSWAYRQRLAMFAQDTLEYAGKIKQYSENLLPLVQVTFDPAANRELRRRSLAICKTHARELQKYAKKLHDNLSIALPMASGKDAQRESDDRGTVANETPPELAALLVGETKDLSNGVYRFIFPTNHSVTLVDLANPPLMRKLEKMRENITRFRNIVNESSIVKAAENEKIGKLHSFSRSNSAAF